MSKSHSGNHADKPAVKDMLHTLKNDTESDVSGPDFEAPGFLSQLGQRVFDWLSKVDTRKIKERVKTLREEQPQATEQELIELLIRNKCQYTAQIGAVTAATGTVPLIGTAISLTVGMVLDLSAVITAQAELVLEIAEVHQLQLSNAQKRDTILVVLGLGSGMQRLSTQVSQRFLHNLARRFGQRWFAHVLPVAGIAAAAGINAMSTYIIGRRAQTYFAKGPAAVGNWQTSLRGLTGFDEHKLSKWLTQEGNQLGSGLWDLGSNLYHLARAVVAPVKSSSLTATEEAAAAADADTLKVPDKAPAPGRSEHSGMPGL